MNNVVLPLHLIAVSLVYFSETINTLAAEHWRLFSREQYFDSNGLFISTVFSIPILLNCMLMIVSTDYLLKLNKNLNAICVVFREPGCTDPQS